MTKEELAKVPFKFSSHISMANAHQSVYFNKEYGLQMVRITQMKCDGMIAGRSRTHYYYDGQWYRSFKKFLEAIKDIKFKPIEK